MLKENKKVVSSKVFKLKEQNSPDHHFTNIGHYKCFKLGIIENETENKENKTFLLKQTNIFILDHGRKKLKFCD